MFHSLRLHGGPATLVWGYRTAAELRSWSIAHVGGHWTLIATISRADAFQCRQAIAYRELLFEAPRAQGRWCWSVDGHLQIDGNQLRAILGPPLQ